MVLSRNEQIKWIACGVFSFSLLLSPFCLKYISKRELKSPNPTLLLRLLSLWCAKLLHKIYWWQKSYAFKSWKNSWTMGPWTEPASQQRQWRNEHWNVSPCTWSQVKFQSTHEESTNNSSPSLYPPWLSISPAAPEKDKACTHSTYCRWLDFLFSCQWDNLLVSFDNAWGRNRQNPIGRSWFPL